MKTGISTVTDLPLFRAQAQLPGFRRLQGVPISTAPISWRVLSGFLLLAFASVILFLSTQTISRRESAVGVLSHSLGEIRVVPPRAGVVTDVFVSESEEVVDGQRLAYVSTAQHFIDGEGLEGHLLTAMSEERRALTEQLLAVNASAPTERRGQKRSLEAQTRRLQDLRQLLPNAEERLSLAERAYEQAVVFNRQGALSGDTLRQRQYDLLDQRADAQALRAQIAELEGVIARGEADFDQLKEQHSTKRAEISTRLAALQQREISTSIQKGYLIVSRVTGRVSALQVRVGQFVDASKPLMTIAPKGSRIQAELYVPSKAIAFVKPGQQVRLLYDAFPYQLFGAARGTIGEISSTVLRPEEIGASVQLKEPAYRVLVNPDKTVVNAYGVDVPIRSGMALTADILLEQRSFMQLLLDPLRASSRRISGE